MARTALARFRNAVNPVTNLDVSGAWFGWTIALASTFAFSIAPTVSRGAILSGMDPTALLLARMVISTLLLGGSLALAAPTQLKIDRRGFLVAGTAGLANGVGMLTFFWSLARINASVASMIFTLNPLVVLGLLALRGEKLSHRHLFRLTLGLSGVYLLVGPNGQVDPVGTFLVLIAVVSFALQLVLIQWFLQGYTPGTVTFYLVASMTVVVVGWWLLAGAEWHAPGWQGWLAIGTLAVVSTYLARLALFMGVRYLGGGQVALLTPLETFLTVIWSLLFLHERLTAWQWAGGALILSSALLAIQRLRGARWRPRWRAWPRL